MKLGDVGEFGLIERIARRVGDARPPVSVGIGDDASVLVPPAGVDLVTTTDTLIQGVHFLVGGTPFEDLGYKSLSVNLSDLAAMGARPLQAFLSLGLPPDCQLEEVDRFIDGFLEASPPGLQLSGGDTVMSPGGWVVSVTLIGQCPAGRVLLRSAARPGDLVFVTGTLGDSAAGLSIIMGKSAPEDDSDRRYLVKAHNRPMAQLEAGRILSDSGVCRCAIDVSDGFLQDLGHLCSSSRVRAEVDLDSLPVSAAAENLARMIGLDPFLWPLTGGEDYQLIFTLPADGPARSLIFSMEKAGTRTSRVGRIVSGEGVVLFEQGRPRPVPPRTGHNHFRA